MTIIRNFNFSEKKVSAVKYDDNGYIWIAFEKNSSDECVLHKASANNPNQTYYEIDFSVDKMNAMDILGDYLYIVIEDSSDVLYKISLNFPFSSQTTLEIPSGCNEAPIDIIDDGTYLYFLTPGTDAGENAKIYKYNTFLVLQDIIDLTTINNAKSFTIDSNDEIWIVTNESPSELVRVYETSGGIYTYSTTTLN